MSGDALCCAVHAVPIAGIAVKKYRRTQRSWLFRQFLLHIFMQVDNYARRSIDDVANLNLAWNRRHRTTHIASVHHFSLASGINMRIFSQTLKPLITALFKPRESAAGTARVAQVAQVAQSVRRASQHTALSGTSPDDTEKLTRLTSRLIMNTHHEEATRSLVTRMILNQLPEAPTHLPDFARMQQMREQKKLEAMLPAVPTHIPHFKSGQKKSAASRLPARQFIYQPVSQARGAQGASLHSVSRNTQILPSKVVIQHRLSIVDSHVININKKIAKLDAGLARTSDPASRLRLIVQRSKEHAMLMQQGSLGVKLRYLANKAGS